MHSNDVFFTPYVIVRFTVFDLHLPNLEGFILLRASVAYCVLLASVTTEQYHYWPVSLLGSVTTRQCHYWAVSLLCIVTTVKCHHCEESPLWSVTTGQCHYWAVSPLSSVTTGKCHYLTVSGGLWLDNIQYRKTSKAGYFLGEKDLEPYEEISSWVPKPCSCKKC